MNKHRTVNCNKRNTINGRKTVAQRSGNKPRNPASRIRTHSTYRSDISTCAVLKQRPYVTNIQRVKGVVAYYRKYYIIL
jgi:hypothetical protein